ncbi:NAD(P)/FAD-dependent oxidoreductase [Enterococcus alishanensis]|uniref:NAD(P)/FAD-dependent oxidoreductase n=1 Tax=Enterococcus alishanensis TaxID=1303817 RepID=A0ABS6TG11_9ENTE|nr:NAD(P)/FAD-dependent oxidoreductase [Enterococcus alishanensis]MBV7391892.1 NAD(P)/FAD-dependent oxidoreductase [Enterococcus alishanensis]
MNYDALFTPFKIGNMEVKNRIVMSPMGTNSAFINGRKDEQEIDYFVERAKGGAGMIILGCQPLNEEIAQGSMEGTLDSFSVLPALTSLVDSVHRYGTKVVCQITCGTGRNAFPDTLGRPPMSASAIPSAFDPNVPCRAMTKQDIQDVMDGFTFAAGLAKDAGFDAIEIHAHAGYLVDQFMSPVWNKRTDEYGGSPENFARFPREIVQAIRKAVGNQLPILFRISLDHRFEGGRTLEDSIPLIQLLEEEGVDAFDIDAGCYETLDYIFPPSYLGESCMSYVNEAARQAVNVPLLNAGTHNPESAVEIIESGNIDFAMIGRGLIADPDLPNKLLAGHREDVRPCIRCNENCIGRIWNNHTKLSCSVNIQAMEERRFKLEQANEVKNIVVIGGGASGMEAARVAATRGHKVTLYEASHRLGGIMRDVATAKFKNNIQLLSDWYETQLTKLGVDVQLNTFVSSDDAILAECDQIFVGCGAEPIVPNIPGIDLPIVETMVAAHRDESLIKGDNIIVCGGGSTGCDGALEMANEMGKNVTIIEMKDEVAQDAMFINRISLLNALNANNVTMLTKTVVQSIEEDGVIVEKADGSTEKIYADTVLNAFGMRPLLNTVNGIKEKYHTKTRVVGDSQKIGKIGDAIRAGFYAGSAV